MTLFSKADHPFQFTDIAEFQPATLLLYATVVCALFLAVFIALFPSLPRDDKQQYIPRFVFLGILLLGGLVVQKFLPYALIALAMQLSVLYSQIQNRADTSRPNLFEAFDKLCVVLSKIPKEGLSFLFLCIGTVYLYRLHANPIDRAFVAKDAFDYIEQEKIPQPVMSDFGTGGYQIYRLSDAEGVLPYLVAVDGRTNVLNDKEWKAYERFQHGKIPWNTFLKKYQPESILWRTSSPVPALLLETGTWRLIKKFGAGEGERALFIKK
jgi:hypothetical protein